MKPELNFHYVHSDHIGYGHHGIETHKALSAAGIDVYDGLPGSRDEEIAKRRAKLCGNILFLSTPIHLDGWWQGQRSHLFTMWETDTLPEQMRETLRQFDTLLVPSRENEEMYCKYHDNVHFVPLGIDGKRWAYRPRQRSHVFNFLVAGSGQRKGVDLVHRAYMELFGGMPIGNGPIPKLIIKGRSSLSGPGVTVINTRLSQDEECDLYGSAHCYVGASRGEGWGMMPMQAIAQGLPTILTDAHGQEAYADYGFGISATKAPADYMRVLGYSGDWWEPNFAELKAAMYSVYTDYDAFLDLAAESSKAIIERFTWNKSAEAIIKAIGGREALARPAPEPRAWVQFAQRKFKVQVRKNWRADIGGVVYLFHQGQTYYESADVKRVLFEAGILDPACITDDDGLTAEEVATHRSAIAAQPNCPTCGQAIEGDDDAHVAS